MKSERLLNLVIMLLVARTPVTKERIRQVIEGYQGSSDEAFEKMFERDKAELRALGIPLEVGYTDPFFEDEQGYLIARDSFELPELDLTADEAAVLGLAARTWRHAGLAETTAQALLKLRAAGYDVDQEALDTLHPRLEVDEPAFDQVWDATVTRTPISFCYARPDQAEPNERRLQPWGLVTRDERWYVIGHDLDRTATRMFRLSRMSGEVRPIGAPGSYELPPDLNLNGLAHDLGPQPPSATAILLARPGRATSLRRRRGAVCEATEVVQPGLPGIWDRLQVPTRSLDWLAADVVGYLGDVVALEPAALVDAVTARLDEAVECAR